MKLSTSRRWTNYGFYSWSQGRKNCPAYPRHKDLVSWEGHIVHATFKELKAGQNPEQEIVAEIFAAVMCELYGVQGYHAHAWDYVKHYADDDPQKALQAVFRVLSDVEECLDRVFKIEKEKTIA